MGNGWEGLFRCFDDGRGGTGNFFFSGGSASETPSNMGGDDVGHPWVEIVVTDFWGDSFRMGGGRHCALDLWAIMIVAARSSGSGFRVSDQTGTWLLLWGDQERGPERHV